jgi:transposase-like protein
MTKKTSNRLSLEVRERAVRMVLEQGSDHASQSMGSDEFDCIEDRLHGRDVAEAGATGQARSREAAWPDERRTRADPSISCLQFQCIPC